MRKTRMLPNKHSIELSVPESRQIKLLLRHNRHSPRPRMVLVMLPAVPRVVARELLASNWAVDLHHSLEDVLDVLGLGHSAGDGCVRRGDVGSEHDARTRLVDAIGRIADLADSVDVDASTAAYDRALEVLPKPGLELHGDFDGAVEDCALDCALEETGVWGHLPEAEEVEGDAVEDVVELFGGGFDF